MDLRSNPQKARALGMKGLEFRKSHLSGDLSLGSFYRLLTELGANSSGSRDGLNKDELRPEGSKLV